MKSKLLLTTLLLTVFLTGCNASTETQNDNVYKLVFKSPSYTVDCCYVEVTDTEENDTSTTYYYNYKGNKCKVSFHLGYTNNYKLNEETNVYELIGTYPVSTIQKSTF